MKHENENNAQEQMQEQICSYLFGELQAKDKAHVEQRFEESEVWRAERDRLQGTIGLVQAAMKADTVVETESEQLSEAAMQSLALAGTQAAASHVGAAPKTGASPMRTFVPMAATLAVALGGFLAFQKMQADPGVDNESTAKADGVLSDSTLGEAEFEIAKRPGSYSDMDRQGGSLMTIVPEEEAEETEAPDALIGGDVCSVDGVNISVTEARGTESHPLAVISEARGRRYAPSPGEPGTAGGGKSGTGPFFTSSSTPSGKPADSLNSFDRRRGAGGGYVRSFSTGGDASPGMGGGGSNRDQNPLDGFDIFTVGAAGSEDTSALPLRKRLKTAPPGDTGVTTGSDEWFLGKGVEQKGPGASPSSKPGSVGGAGGGGGAYRGPSDSTPPPAGAVMPSGPAAGGLSTPGPASASPPVTGGATATRHREQRSVNRQKRSKGKGQDASEEFALDLELEEALRFEAEHKDLSLGLEEQVSRGLDNNGFPQEVEDEAGVPSAGFFFDDGQEGSFSARKGNFFGEELASEAGAEFWEKLSQEDEAAFKARMEALLKRNQEAQAKKDKAEAEQQPAAETSVNRFEAERVVRETPEQVELRLRLAIAERAQKRHERLIHSCIPKPNERPNAMYYRWWGDNPFVYTSSDKQATFAADVDTASYALARRYLTGGNLPTREQVRTEEFVNYFAGDIPAPAEDVFAVQTEMTTSPFGGSKNRFMLRVGIRGKVIPKENRPPMALVFVVDTSGSMSNGNRMDLVKHSLRLLGTELDGRDQVGVVSFSSEARLVLPMTSMDKRGDLESAVQSLSPDGSTNVEDGIRLGYELLSRVPSDGRLRRVVLISDGVANTGNTVADEILKSVKMHRENGINLSTVGVGMGNHNDALLERLANRGDGICDYVDDADAARRAMVERFSGGFIPIARDLKIQLEFENSHVLRYRQIGYENRAVADADFRNDAVDGGEVGSGHQVTALFELECMDLPDAGVMSHIDFGQVRLRYKSIATGSDQQVFETEHALRVQAGPFPFERASSGFARSVVAAQFAEVLRRSTHAAGDDYAALVAQATRIANLPEFAGDGETQELAGMIRRAGSLGAGAPVHRDELWTTVNSYRKHRYLCGSERELSGGKLNSERLAQIAAINADLEARIRELSLREALQGR